MEKVVETLACTKCKQNFHITDKDDAFYAEMGVVRPTHCPHCRQQRRLAFRNERKLYSRKCDFSGETILSVYSQDKAFPVYKNEHWYGSEWDAKDYGRDFDFSRPFFEQFKELLAMVPRLALSTINNQNCDYVNQCGFCKDCYLIFEADGDDSCVYSEYLYDSRSCVDNTHVYNSELCYECVDCRQCYNLRYSQNCVTCNDSWFIKNCIGCMNCFGCVNLRNKQYYIFNEKYSKEEYFKKLEEYRLEDPVAIEDLSKKFLEYAGKFPHKAMFGTQNEDSVGDYLFNTQRCYFCFDVNNAQDCKYAYNARNLKNVYDMTVFGAKEGAEYCVDNHEIGAGVRNIYYSDGVFVASYDIYYSHQCLQGSHNLFGCVGMVKGSYCILNKQYSEEEYEVMKNRIIEHMKSTGEWGQFFPASLSAFGYNETLALDYYPLSKEQALAAGFNWKDEAPKNYLPSSYSGDRKISAVPESITGEVLACADCSKNYKINGAELLFYRQMKLPIPAKCTDCRHKRRMSLRNPRQLFNRKCQQCNIEIWTSYSPERPEPVYCETCFLKAVD